MPSDRIKMKNKRRIHVMAEHGSVADNKKDEKLGKPVLSMGEQNGISSTRVGVIIVKKSILKHFVFVLLFLEILTNTFVGMMQTLHAHLTHIIIFCLVKYHWSYEHFSSASRPKSAIRFSVFFQLFATFSTHSMQMIFFLNYFDIKEF
jgi:hypothetical protein